MSFSLAPGYIPCAKKALRACGVRCSSPRQALHIIPPHLTAISLDDAFLLLHSKGPYLVIELTGRGAHLRVALACLSPANGLGLGRITFQSTSTKA